MLAIILPVITKDPSTKLAISRSIPREIWVSHLAAFTDWRKEMEVHWSLSSLSHPHPPSWSSCATSNEPWLHHRSQINNTLILCFLCVYVNIFALFSSGGKYTYFAKNTAMCYNKRLMLRSHEAKTRST